MALYSDWIVERNLPTVQTMAWRLLPALAVLLAGAPSADAAKRAHHPAHGAAHRPAHTRRAEDVCPHVGTVATAVARIADGDTFIAGDGHEIDLAGVLAPGSGGERLSAEQVQAARTAFERALSVGPVTLAVSGQPDRYGRLKAQVFAGGDWVQARLVNDGLVRAAPDLASAPCAAAVFAIEKRARDGGQRALGRRHVCRADARYASPCDRHVSDRRRRGRIGGGREKAASISISAPTGKRDFTITIAPEDMRNFRRLHVDWKALAGKRVRVRGWMEFYNGPMISLHAPGAIEFLDPMPEVPRTPPQAAEAKGK